MVVVVGGSRCGRAGGFEQALLLCERALWPAKANAQPPVGRELIGGAGEARERERVAVSGGLVRRWVVKVVSLKVAEVILVEESLPLRLLPRKEKKRDWGCARGLEATSCGDDGGRQRGTDAKGRNGGRRVRKGRGGRLNPPAVQG